MRGAKYNKYVLIFQGKCKNKNRKCEMYKRFGWCRRRYVSWMSKNCKKSCNKCTNTKPKTSGKYSFFLQLLHISLNMDEKQSLKKNHF